jgi:hypothetical protein
MTFGMIGTLETTGVVHNHWGHLLEEAAILRRCPCGPGCPRLAKSGLAMQKDQRTGVVSWCRGILQDQEFEML